MKEVTLLVVGIAIGYALAKKGQENKRLQAKLDAYENASCKVNTKEGDKQ